MRLLITTHGGAGHFHPLAPIADAALASGHEVSFAVEPPYDQRISAAGYSVRPMGMSFDFSAPERTFAEAGQRSGIDGAMWMMEHVFFGALANAALPDVTSIIRDWRPDVVLNETSEIGGLLAAELEGVPHATFNYGGLDLSVLRFVAGAAWDRIRRRAGLPADPDFAAMTGAPIIAAMPARWAGDEGPPNVHRIALPLYDQLDGAPPLEPTPDGAPIVYATLGTVNRDRATLAAVVAALGAVATPAVVTTGDGLSPADLPAPPNNVRVCRYLPSSQLLPRARAVVHHGGFNTLLGALRFGLPQVLLPMDADQPINAARAEELGLAIVLPPEARQPATIAGAIARVLDAPHFAARARVLQADIDALEPPASAVRVLEALARGS